MNLEGGSLIMFYVLFRLSLYFDGYVDFLELLIPCWAEVKCLRI